MDGDDRGDDEQPLAQTGGAAGAEDDEMRAAAEEMEDVGRAEDAEDAPLARVRYGLGKELRLYSDAIVVAYLEAHEETRYALEGVRRLILVPGEYSPSKLVVMFELDDGNTVIAAEGMTNVRGFRQLIARLREVAPQIELDPDNMDEQLGQALDIRRRYSLGCYGVVIGSCLLLWVFYLVVALIGHVHH